MLRGFRFYHDRFDAGVFDLAGDGSFDLLKMSHFRVDYRDFGRGPRLREICGCLSGFNDALVRRRFGFVHKLEDHM